MVPPFPWFPKDVLILVNGYSNAGYIHPMYVSVHAESTHFQASFNTNLNSQNKLHKLHKIILMRYCLHGNEPEEAAQSLQSLTKAKMCTGDELFPLSRCNLQPGKFLGESASQVLLQHILLLIPHSLFRKKSNN